MIRGWCPGALRPMESGDGWVVRIRPPGGRLDRAQAQAIADGAEAHGNGVIELTGRANLQLRGVTPASHAPLIEALRPHGLIDADARAEGLRNIIVTPFADAEADRLAAELAEALAASALALPAKFGFAVDPCPAPVLTRDPADIRIEAGPTLRADGASLAAPYHGPDDALALARWFLEQGGAPGGRGRMAALTARLTPWRMVLAEGTRHLPATPELILDPRDPRLRLRACPGAPACPQAHASTRPLARALAPLIPADAVLHVSGCTKGCGWPRAADITLTGTDAGFDLIRHGRAQDTPSLRGLDPDQLPKVL